MCHGIVAGKLAYEPESCLLMMYTLSTPCGYRFTAASSVAFNYLGVTLTFQKTEASSLFLKLYL